jgi:hypothetical protein
MLKKLKRKKPLDMWTIIFRASKVFNAERDLAQDQA